MRSKSDEPACLLLTLHLAGQSTAHIALVYSVRDCHLITVTVGLVSRTVPGGHFSGASVVTTHLLANTDTAPGRLAFSCSLLLAGHLQKTFEA
jgi:hypothetical protein